MFWTGLIARLLYLTVSHSYRFRPLQDHFQFGWEMGRIARALVTGYGYADPFEGHTGPTAWTPPLYPLLMAAVFKLFGVYSAASGWTILALNSVFSAATAPAVYEIARRCYGPRADGRKVALWSGWLWALYPAAMQYAVRWPWEMSLTCCFFTWALAVGLRLRGVGGPPQAEDRALWSVYGLLWGLAGLCNSSVLLFLPLQAVWILWPRRHDIRRKLLPALSRSLLALTVFLLCLLPWVLRNALVFHAFVPMRANFGAELFEAADPVNEGFPVVATLPLARHSPQLRHYADMGELAYQYAILSITGLLGLLLSLHRRVPAAGIFAAAFAVLPLIYYAVTVQARFRHPLEPLITILTVYLVQSAEKGRVWTGRI